MRALIAIALELLEGGDADGQFDEMDQFVLP
jgi:hypothetical protein